MKKFRSLLALSSASLLLAACANTAPVDNDDVMEGDSMSSAMMEDDSMMMQSSDAMMEDDSMMAE